MVNTKNATVTTINEEEYVTAIIEPKEVFPLSVHTKGNWLSFNIL